MKLLGVPLQNITPDIILRLVDNKVPEAINLDYKRDLPSNSDGGKKEFLADVSSFANTIGGTIVYGIEEEKDEQGKNTGIPGEIVGLGEINVETETQRLGSIIRDGLEPKLNNFLIKDIDVGDQKVLLIGTPRSLFAPHMINFKNDGKYHSRHNSSKYQMDVREIKQAFLQTDSWEKEADNFRRQRVMDVRSLKIMPNVDNEGSYFIHILPLGSNRTAIDLKTYRKKLKSVPPPRCRAYDDRFNLDGFLVYGVSREKCNTYIQYFRNGGVEIYTTRLYDSENKKLDATWVEGLAVTYINQYSLILETLGIELPLIIFLTLMDLKDIEIEDRRGFPSSHFDTKFDRDDILFPGVVLDDLNIDIPKLLHPIFDMLWQAAGLNESPSYDKDGNWKY